MEGKGEISKALHEGIYYISKSMLYVCNLVVGENITDADTVHVYKHLSRLYLIRQGLLGMYCRQNLNYHELKSNASVILQQYWDVKLTNLQVVTAMIPISRYLVEVCEYMQLPKNTYSKYVDQQGQHRIAYLNTGLIVFKNRYMSKSVSTVADIFDLLYNVLTSDKEFTDCLLLLAVIMVENKPTIEQQVESVENTISTSTVA